MKIQLLPILLLIFSSTLWAQETTSSELLVRYDPLFWKNELKLDPDQCQKIKEINFEYYESLFIAYREEKDDRNTLRSIAKESLQRRSDEIWETFHPKQRKRWKRIWQPSTTHTNTNES